MNITASGSKNSEMNDIETEFRIKSRPFLFSLIHFEFTFSQLIYRSSIRSSGISPVPQLNLGKYPVVVRKFSHIKGRATKRPTLGEIISQIATVLAAQSPTQDNTFVVFRAYLSASLLQVKSQISSQNLLKCSLIQVLFQFFYISKKALSFLFSCH